MFGFGAAGMAKPWTVEAKPGAAQRLIGAQGIIAHNIAEPAGLWTATAPTATRS